MAVTRINNNQITTAVGGNAYLGINAASKLQNYSITSNKIANSLVYGSDLTVSGNLTVNGTTTTVDTVNTLIKDPILTLADGQTAGTPVVDIGILGLRGNQNSSFLGWNEGNTEFAAVLTTTTASNTTVVITQYGNFHANTITAQGNLSVVGNIVGSANFTGNVTAGNLLTPGLISATSNVTGGNILTAGIVSSTGNAISGNVLTAGLVSATSNISGGNLLTAGLISTVGNIYVGASNAGYVFGNAFYMTGLNAAVSVSKITNGGSFANIAASNGNLVVAIGSSSNTVATFYDQGVNFTGPVSATGNVTGGNILTAGVVSATANVIGGNVVTAGNVSATGNVTGGNINTGGNVNATSAFVNAGAVLASGRVEAGTTMSAGGNITGGANILATGYISSGGNITGANILTSGLISATSTITSAANITGGNLLTAGLVSATGNVNGGNIISAALVQGANLSATANVTTVNVLASGYVSAAGNVTSATNVNTPNVVGASGLTISTGSGNINLSPTSGNIVVNNTYINGIAQPVQDNDAASKIYVDNLVSTQIAYHQAVYAATTANLATTTGGTITYNNGANGVGATITTTGTFNLIDTANVQTANTRILVKNEGNAALNGVYVWSNATVITRSTDADTYGPNSSTDLSINDYFFVQTGNVNKGSAYIVDAPSGVITFGTSNISFAQFSSSQTYTGGNGISLYGTVISTVYDNSTIGVNGSNQLYIPANAPLVTPNIGAATGTSLSVTGAITAGTNLSAVANVIAGNVTTAGLVSATGNVTGGNVLTAGLISATGNATAGNVLTAGVVSATANITGGNILTAGLISATSTITSAANISGGNILTVGLISATGNATAGNILTVGVVSATANITGGNVLTAGLISATGNATAGNVLTAGVVSATANVTGGNLLTGGLISATSNITGGNILYGSGIVSGTGNIYGANLIVSNIESVAGNITGGNLLTGGLISATSNITGGNILTAGVVSATGNVNGGNVISVALVQGANLSATANVIAVNGLYSGFVSAAGNVYGGNIVLTGNNINQLNADSIIAINGAQGNTNTAIYGQNNSNPVFFVSGASNVAAFGNSTTYTNALVAFNSYTSILLPAGNTSVRPSNASSQTGMVRFNTTLNTLEVYDNTHWTTVGGTTFTVIADEQFTGDGSTVAFTLGSTQTTNSCIVSINGIVQIPGTAYSVAGTSPTCVLTFTEAPAISDLIDVREITTTTTVTAIQNNSGNATVTGNSSASQIDVLGNLVPSGNAVYTLGTATNYWKSLYVGGNTIYLGGLQLQSAAGNVFSVTTDGSTPVPMTTGNITVTNILNGGANGAGNIGNSTTYFNTVFAKATSAQYADLAEKYVADAEYAPGTVVSFGGEKEVTKSTVDADRAVAGVVSTNPSYIMNATLEAEHVAVVAFTGRVPTSVTGTVAKGDLMVSNGDGTARAEADPKAGAIIGKALENFDGDTGVIEVVIGRF